MKYASFLRPTRLFISLSSPFIGRYPHLCDCLKTGHRSSQPKISSCTTLTAQRVAFTKTTTACTPHFLTERSGWRGRLETRGCEVGGGEPLGIEIWILRAEWAHLCVWRNVILPKIRCPKMTLAQQLSACLGAPGEALLRPDFYSPRRDAIIHAPRVIGNRPRFSCCRLLATDPHDTHQRQSVSKELWDRGATLRACNWTCA